MEPNKRIRRQMTISFIVRCWPHHTPQGMAWQGEVEHVQSGRKKAFILLGKLTDVVREMLQAVPAFDRAAATEDAPEEQGEANSI